MEFLNTRLTLPCYAGKRIFNLYFRGVGRENLGLRHYFLRYRVEQFIMKCCPFLMTELNVVYLITLSYL